MAEIRWYSPGEFRASIKPASWGNEPTWNDVIAQMLFCPFDYETVSILQRERRRDGNFREPVVAIDGVVANGMHRSVASLIPDELLGDEDE